MFRLRFTFTKESPIRFLSHLDMMKLMERALRRAELPVLFSQGHTPRMKLSLAWPLSVGMTAAAEYADVVLEKWIAADKIPALLNYVMPAGCRVTDAKMVDMKQDSLTAQVTAARWEVTPEPGAPVQEMTLPAGPKENTRIQDMFPKTALLHRAALIGKFS